MALEIFRLVGSVFVDTDKADKSLKKTDKNAEGVGTKLVNAAKSAATFATGVVTAAAGAGAAIVALAESTREYRTEQGQLQAAFETSGFAAGEARDTYEALNGVLGDSGQAIEAANHLAKLCKTTGELADWTNICTGIYATFGASLPIEGLTEAANETAKVGQVTGSLADALNWAGISEDAFNESLAACSTEQERQSLITETLNGLYSEAADNYREVNGEVIAANEAQDKLNASMAKIGGAIEPIITQGKALIAEVLDRSTPAIETLSNVVIPFLVSAIMTLFGWMETTTEALSDSGITFETVMGTLQSLFSETMAVLQTIWNTIGQPVWSLISQAVGLVAGYFEEKMPEIQAFVQTAFTDIQQLWQNNLQPALKAIGDFIENVLAPAFEFVFKTVVEPVVDEAFRAIGALWTGTLKPVFEGILDFITGVFTLDFENAFGGLVKVIDGIWAGIETVLEAPINAAVDVIEAVIDGISSIFKDPINAIIKGINGFIDGVNSIKIPDWVPGVGGLSLSLGKLPYLEKGAVLKRGQVGILEGNGAEAVVPLERNKQWISAVARDMDGALGHRYDPQIAAILLDILALLEKFAEMGIYLDTDALVGGLANPMYRKMGQIQATKARV